MITLHLNPIFIARAIDKPYSFLVRNGFTPQMAKGLIDGKRTNINLKYMERLCELLWCEPNDLFLWQPANGAQIAPEHPLRPLLKKDMVRPVSIREQLAKVPLKELSKGFGRSEEVKVIAINRIGGSRGSQVSGSLINFFLPMTQRHKGFVSLPLRERFYNFPS
jgi:DNA-binding Xre family transcriptional regulator